MHYKIPPYSLHAQLSRVVKSVTEVVKSLCGWAKRDAKMCNREVMLSLKKKDFVKAFQAVVVV